MGDLADRGLSAISIGSVGTGESGRPPEGREQTFESTAHAHAQSVAELRRRLCEGSLSAAVEPMPGQVLIGVGHSMAGAASIVQQALYSSFDCGRVGIQQPLCGGVFANVTPTRAS
jgi:hypothetical protein